MTALSIVLILFGLIVIGFRAPLMWAPAKHRDFILGLFSTDQKMRLLGLLFAVIGIAFVKAAWDVSATPGPIVHFFGILIFFIALVIALFPAKMRGLATRIWQAFSEPMLRVIGALSTIFGLLLVFYGFSL